MPHKLSPSYKLTKLKLTGFSGGRERIKSNIISCVSFLRYSGNSGASFSEYFFFRMSSGSRMFNNQDSF